MRIDPFSFLSPPRASFRPRSPHGHFIRCSTQLSAPPTRHARGVCTTHASATRTPNGFSRPHANAHASSRPARKNTLCSFLSSHDSRRTPRLSFSAPPRALTRTRAHHARLSQFQKKAFTSSPASCISLLHSGLRVKDLAFFPSPLSSRGVTPKVKNFRRGFSPKTGTNREETGGTKR